MKQRKIGHRFYPSEEQIYTSIALAHSYIFPFQQYNMYYVFCILYSAPYHTGRRAPSLPPVSAYLTSSLTTTKQVGICCCWKSPYLVILGASERVSLTKSYIWWCWKWTHTVILVLLVGVRDKWPKSKYQNFKSTEWKYNGKSIFWLF